MSAKCLITGCDLLDKHSGRQAHGDLWQSGDQFIFNACLDLKGETAWVYDPHKRDGAKYLIIDQQVNYFERRGVIVVDQLHCLFNPTASAYLKKDYPYG